jgi:hypothetical protein
MRSGVERLPLENELTQFLASPYTQIVAWLCTVLPVAIISIKRSRAQVETRSKIEPNRLIVRTEAVSNARFEVFSCTETPEENGSSMLSFVMVTFVASAFSIILASYLANLSQILSIIVFLVTLIAMVRYVVPFAFKLAKTTLIIFDLEPNDPRVFYKGFLLGGDDLVVSAHADETSADRWRTQIVFFKSSSKTDDANVATLWVAKTGEMHGSEAEALGEGKPIAEAIAARYGIRWTTTSYKLNRLGRLLKRRKES